MKNNRLAEILSSVITLLPMGVGLFLMKWMPETIATHWGLDGTADAWGSPLLLVIGIPMIFFVLHIALLLIEKRVYKKNATENKKVFAMTIWMLPFTSCFVSAAIFAFSLGVNVNMTLLISIMLGVTAITIGNYLPKCRQNLTIGIKTVWTLASKENWNATHRIAGKTTFASGIATLFLALIPKTFLISIFLFVIGVAVIPTVYSYFFYRKQVKDGSWQEEKKDSSVSSKKRVASVIIIAVTLVAVVVVLFTGDVSVKYGETSFTLDSIYSAPLTVSYDDIEDVFFAESVSSASKTNGFSSMRLSLGWFKNGEFGDHVRYAYRNADGFIILTVNEKTVIVSTKDSRALYEKILEELEKRS